MDEFKKNIPKRVQQIVNLIVDHPYRSLLSAFFIMMVFAPGILQFEEKYDVRIWFRDSDPNIKVLNQFERQFGNDENLVVAVHAPDGIFDQESLKLISKLTDQMWKLPQVIRVDSLTNFNVSEGLDDDIFIRPFIDLEEKTFDQLDYNHLKKEALNHKVLPGYLVSHDAKSAMIFARLVTTLDDSPDYQKIISSMRSVISNIQNKGDHTFHITGEAGVNDAFREVSNDDGARILPVLFFVIISFMFFTFRSITATLLPLVVMVSSILMTLGLCFYVGWTFNSILSILPGILVAIAIADSVHIIVTYFQIKAKVRSSVEASKLSLMKNFIPTLLTSLSTSIGFFSLTTTELMPIRQLGLLAGVGAFFAWIISILFLGPMLALIDFKVPYFFTKDRASKRGISKPCTNFIFKNKIVIVIIFSLLGVGSFFYGIKNEINSNPYSYFTDKIPLKIANDFIQDSFGGNAGPEIIIYSNEENGIKNPIFLKKVEVFKNWIDSLPFVNKTIDITDVIKEMNQTLNGGDKSFYKIPDTQKEVAEVLFLYTMGLPQGMDLNNRMTLKYDAMRMSVLWSIFDTRGWLENVDLLEQKANELGLHIKTTGKFLLFQRMMDYVVLTFFGSITMAMVLVGILMSFLFKSIKLGVFSLIPNILPLIYGSAFMKLMGMQLNIGTALVASVCLGIAVDDTIHFLSNYYRLKKSGKEDKEIIEEIFHYTGSALFITTIILASGFGLYVFGDFIPNINFGLICAAVLSAALLVDLVFLPALLFLITDLKSIKSRRFENLRDS